MSLSICCKERVQERFKAEKLRHERDELPHGYKAKLQALAPLENEVTQGTTCALGRKSTRTDTARLLGDRLATAVK